jgi:hypothetical protein
MTPEDPFKDTDTITSWYLFTEVCATSHTQAPHVHSQPSCTLQPYQCWQPCLHIVTVPCSMIFMLYSTYITIILTSTVLNHTSLTYKYLATFACVRYYSYFHTTCMLFWIISKISINIQTLGTKL